MAQCSTSATSELTQWSGSLTHLASDLGQVHQKVRMYGTFLGGLRQLSLRRMVECRHSDVLSILRPTIFLIKDYYDAGKINVKLCPMDKMWADILTKPLQGQKFRDMRAFLQNCPQDYNDDNKLKKLMNPQDVASLWECVSEHTKSLLKSRPESPTCIS